MHIVYLVHAFPALGGLAASGAGNYVANMALTMKQNGHEVTIVTESNENQVYNWNGIELHHIIATPGFKDTGRSMPTWKKLLKNLSRSYWYNREVNKINSVKPIDIVQSVNTFGIVLFRNRRIPYLVRVSDDPYMWRESGFIEFDFIKTLNSRQIDNEMQYWALKKADKVIAPSYFMIDLLKKKANISATVVEGPVYIEYDEKKLILEERLEKDKYWLTFGFLTYRKQIHIITDIMDDLLELYPDMKFVLIGKDKEIRFENKYVMASEYFNQKIKRNSDRFIFLGEISNRKRLFNLIKNARICLLPTRMDNLPNTCMEAMALNKIVVSSTSEYGTSVEQLIEDGISGFLAEVDDADALKGKMIEAMQMNDNDRKKMEMRAGERIEKMTPANVYCIMITIYDELIEKYEKENGRNIKWK